MRLLTMHVLLLSFIVNFVNFSILLFTGSHSLWGELGYITLLIISFSFSILLIIAIIGYKPEWE